MLGDDRPTALITNQMRWSLLQVVDRYARRMIIENVISDAINPFHMDALSLAAPTRINVYMQLTVMTRVLYRLKGPRRTHGYAKAGSHTISRDLVQHRGRVTITEDAILVQLQTRSNGHNLISAGYPTLREFIPWLTYNTLRIRYSMRL